jgi:hypothetical protein
MQSNMQNILHILTTRRVSPGAPRYSYSRTRLEFNMQPSLQTTKKGRLFKPAFSINSYFVNPIRRV